MVKKKTDELQQQISDLTLDLQRTRADFENYRKRVEFEKNAASEMGETRAVLRLLPVIDTIERAVQHIPADIAGHQWVQGVAGLVKQLDKSLSSMQVDKITAGPGTPFDPELHQAVQFDDEAEGEQEVVAEELQSGYKLKGTPLRCAIVKVTRK